MTALSITAASVVFQSGKKLDGQVAGEAFSAGALLYKAGNGTWLKAQGDGTAVEAGANMTGIALASADAAGALLSVAVPDEVSNPGTIVAVGAGTAGIVYYAGDTAGAIVPVADVGSTDKINPVAIGIGSNKLMLIRGYHPGAVLA